MLNILASRGRHYKISYIITSQKYNYIDSNIRNNSDEVILFKINNNLERKAIDEDLSVRNIDMDKLIDYATDAYNYFLLLRGKEDRYFKCNLLNCKELEIEN